MLPDIQQNCTVTVERNDAESAPAYSRLGEPVPAWRAVQALAGLLYQAREKDQWGNAGRVLVGQFCFDCNLAQYVPVTAGNPFAYTLVTADVRVGDRLRDANGDLYRVDGAIDPAGEGDHLEVSLTRYKPEEAGILVPATPAAVALDTLLGNDPGNTPDNDPLSGV